MISPRILLIDDHAMFRTGLRLVLNSGLRNAEIFEACSLNEAMRCTVDAIDAVLLDIKLRGLNGLEGIALVNRKWPQTPVLILSSQDAPETQRLALERGAVGFISKAETADTIIGTLQRVLRGHVPERSPAAPCVERLSLTPRQFEVLDLLNQGLSNKLIARQLALSENTVRRHVQDILVFFQVVNRAEAVFAARSQGLLG